MYLMGSPARHLGHNLLRQGEWADIKAGEKSCPTQTDPHDVATLATI